MAVERQTKKISVRLVDGNKADVLIYTRLPFRQAQQLQSDLFKGVNISQKKAAQDDIEIPIDRTMELIGKVAEMIWADKNYTLDDVEHGSLQGEIQEHLNCFLQGLGYEAKISNNESS